MTGLELTIFLSGTMQDLCEEREAIRAQIGPPLYRIVAAEDWGARYRPPRDLCIQAAQGSDIYLGLYGGCYGCVPKGEEISVTEWEFNAAREMDKPAIVYVRRGRKGPRQRQFLARVSDFCFGHSKRPDFGNRDQLVAWVKEDLIRLMEDLSEDADEGSAITRDYLIYVKCRLNLALLASEQGQREQAIRHYQWVLQRGVWNLEVHTRTLRELCSLCIVQGSWEDAIDAVYGSVDLLHLMGLPTDESSGFGKMLYQELARIYRLRARNDYDSADYEGAVDSYREAEQVYQEIGERQDTREVHFALAETYERWAKACTGVHRWADAADHCRDALALYAGLEDPAKIALIWYELGQIRKEQRKSREALNCFERCLEYRTNADDIFVIPFETILSAHDEIITRRLAREGEFHYAVLQLCERSDDLFIAGQIEEAIAGVQRALNLSRKRQDQRSIIASRLCLGSLLMKNRQPEQAIGEYEMVLELAESLGDEKAQGEVLDRLEKAAQKYRGDLQRAIKQGNDRDQCAIQGYLDRLQVLLLRGYNGHAPTP